ncbi:lipoprotein insertase outer membrane protein LolB [Legionella saoudiensis]|uniref:lipoprotein insertase outer membrane protein LolB n=1 Tax=Legionella saoudiensis TaxID=1750561 RepID=UPI000730559C|nr:lipoprotein insertase outer membrane protein LolB [Legionella saoudiensis]
MDNLKRFIVLPIFLLTACAPPRPPVMMPEQPSKVTKALPKGAPAEKAPAEKAPVEKQHAAKAETVSSWEIRGALAAKNKSKGWSAAMHWTQNGPNSYQIRLMGPLGAGAVLINKKGGTITFQDGPKRITSTNADELLLKQTGVRLPVSNLYYWVRGLPAPGKVSSEKRDAANNLVMLRQSGYTITFGNYTSVKGVALPGMVRLDGNGVMVKVVIKNWAI